METIEFTLACNSRLKADRIKRAYLVKHKRKTMAKIHEYTDGGFRVEINGIAWDKKSLDECREQVVENYAFFLDVLGWPAKIRIVNAPQVVTSAYYVIGHRDREDGEIWYFHIIRESLEAAKAQLFTYPPKESDIISISIYPVDTSYINSTGFTCLERGLFSDNPFEELMHREDC